MTSILLEYRLRIRDAGDTTDVLVVSSVRGDTLPYLSEPPSGDGAEFDPLTGAFRTGTMQCRVVDAITSGTSRVLTAQLEDANARQQLAGRPAYIEVRENAGAWVNVYAGIVTAIRLASASEWDVDVGDTMRATRNLVAFAPKVGESLSAYLTRWPNRGCLAGGPVIGGYLGMPDYNGWEMVCASSYTWFTGGPQIRQLDFVAGHAGPDFDKRKTDLNDVKDPINQLVGNGASNFMTHTFPADLYPSLWRDLVVQVDNLYYAAVPEASVSSFGYLGSANGQSLFVKDKKANGCFVYDPNATLPISSTVHRVRVYDAVPTERSPIYYTGHPLDLWTKLLDEAGLTYDSAAVSACKDTLGRQLRINLRITNLPPLDSFLEGVLYGPVGFSARTNASGQLVPFVTRITLSTLPAVTLTAADIPSDTSALFELSEPDAVTRLNFSLQNLIPTQKGDNVTAPLDGVNVQDVQVVRTSGDAAATVKREQSYTIPGFLDTGTGRYEPEKIDAFAREIFDRYGRGRLSGEVLALRNGAGASINLGDEIILAALAMPNHNKRLGDDNTVVGRVVQVVRITPAPRGKQLRYVDSGPNAQPVATLPVVTVGAGSAAGLVTYTITNAATLNAASIGVRVQWAQTTGAAPNINDYTDLTAYAPGSVPTGAVILPAVLPGNTVWVRARSEQAGLRPSNYSTGVSFAATAYSVPSAFTATPQAGDGSKCDLAWTTGAGATGVGVDVFVRLSADPASNDVLRYSLPAGSLLYTLDGLTPSTSYTASVRHRDATGQVSAKATATFTTSATTAALAAPVDQVGFSGSLSASGELIQNGEYGIQVTASVIPSRVEVWEATETGIGTGIYSSFASIGSVPSVQGGVTRYTTSAPNDGKRRRLEARHTRDGMTSSAFTSFVTVLPWSSASAGIGTAGGELLGLCILLGIDPVSNSYSLKCNDTAAAGSSVTVVATCIGTTFSDFTSVKTFTIASGSGAATIIVLRKPVNTGTAQIQIDYTATNRVADQVLLDIPAQGQDAPPVVALTVKEDGNVNASINGNNNQASFRWLVSTSSMPSDASVLSGGTIVNGRTATLVAIAFLSLGMRCYFKMIPYDGASASGTAGQSIGVESDRQNQVTTGKRITFGGAGAEPTASTYTWTRGGGAIQNSGFSQTLVLDQPLTLPDGVTITAIESTTYRDTNGETATVGFYYYPRGTWGAGATQIGSTQTNSTTAAAQQISQGSLSHVVDNNANFYVAVITLLSGASGIAALMSVGIVYTSPNLATGT